MPPLSRRSPHSNLREAVFKEEDYDAILNAYNDHASEESAVAVRHFATTTAASLIANHHRLSSSKIHHEALSLHEVEDFYSEAAAKHSSSTSKSCVLITTAKDPTHVDSIVDAPRPPLSYLAVLPEGVARRRQIGVHDEPPYSAVSVLLPSECDADEETEPATDAEGEDDSIPLNRLLPAPKNGPGAKKPSMSAAVVKNAAHKRVDLAVPSFRPRIDASEGLAAIICPDTTAHQSICTTSTLSPSAEPHLTPSECASPITPTNKSSPTTEIKNLKDALHETELTTCNIITGLIRDAEATKADSEATLHRLHQDLDRAKRQVETLMDERRVAELVLEELWGLVQGGGPGQISFQSLVNGLVDKLKPVGGDTTVSRTAYTSLFPPPPTPTRSADLEMTHLSDCDSLPDRHHDDDASATLSANTLTTRLTTLHTTCATLASTLSKTVHPKLDLVLHDNQTCVAANLRMAELTIHALETSNREEEEEAAAAAAALKLEREEEAESCVGSTVVGCATTPAAPSSVVGTALDQVTSFGQMILKAAAGNGGSSVGPLGLVSPRNSVSGLPPSTPTAGPTVMQRIKSVVVGGLRPTSLDVSVSNLEGLEWEAKRGSGAGGIQSVMSPGVLSCHLLDSIMAEDIHDPPETPFTASPTNCPTTQFARHPAVASPFPDHSDDEQDNLTFSTTDNTQTSCGDYGGNDTITRASSTSPSQNYDSTDERDSLNGRRGVVLKNLFDPLQPTATTTSTPRVLTASAMGSRSKSQAPTTSTQTHRHNHTTTFSPLTLPPHESAFFDTTNIPSFFVPTPMHRSQTHRVAPPPREPARREVPSHNHRAPTKTKSLNGWSMNDEEDSDETRDQVLSTTRDALSRFERGLYEPSPPPRRHNGPTGDAGITNVTISKGLWMDERGGTSRDATQQRSTFTGGASACIEIQESERMPPAAAVAVPSVVTAPTASFWKKLNRSNSRHRGSGSSSSNRTSDPPPPPPSAPTQATPSLLQRSLSKGESLFGKKRNSTDPHQDDFSSPPIGTPPVPQVPTYFKKGGVVKVDGAPAGLVTAGHRVGGESVVSPVMSNGSVNSVGAGDSGGVAIGKRGFGLMRRKSVKGKK
ncbi:hypothetical protein HDU98_012221 [Podochytrium sp. JEL0797]|nr:hypothetical protein HDU98_012221 [Podochytrium sp. JEL0797]